MKFNVEIELNLPREKVVELFDNPDNMKKWMTGLQSFEHISGTPGKPGAKSRLKFQMGKRQIEMVETITARNLPDEFTGTYEAKGVLSETKNFFKDLGNGRTQLMTENEFHFSGIMKLIALLMPGIFKKQSIEYLQNFKLFAESKK